MALTQISTQGIKDGTITGSDLATNVDLVDNQNLRLGTGNDLKLSHDGTDSIITHDTGSGLFRLNTAAGGEVRITKSGPESMARFIPDGAVELYNNGSLKLSTINGGISVTGGVNTTGASSFNGDIFFGDNKKTIFGAGSDLQIYHDGSHSRIVDSGTGHLIIQTSELDLMNAAGNEDMIKATQNGSVELYHDNSKKFETTSGGVQVTDNLNMSGGHIFLADNYKLNVGTGDDLQLLHDGSRSSINNRTGELRVLANNNIRLGYAAASNTTSATENYAIFNYNGSVELYYDNSKKFETTSDGVDITHVAQIGTSNDQGELRIGHDGSSYRARIVSNSSNSLEIDADGPERIQMHGGVIYMRPLNSEKSAAFVANGAVELYYDNSKKFATTSSGINVTGAITVNGSAFTGGKILQVLQTVKTDTFSLSTNDVDTNITGLSVNITPTSTSSKIFVSCTWEHSSNHTNSFGMFFLRRIVSGTTNNICFGDSRGSSVQCTRSHMRVQNLEAKCSNIEFLDSPNTTSQVTYTLALRNTHQGTILVGGTQDTGDDNRTSTPSVITVREVSA